MTSDDAGADGALDATLGSADDKSSNSKANKAKKSRRSTAGTDGLVGAALLLHETPEEQSHVSQSKEEMAKRRLSGRGGASGGKGRGGGSLTAWSENFNAPTGGRGGGGAGGRGSRSRSPSAAASEY